MSDSYVNDIRYTALWRPVVKARVAPAVSLSSPPVSLSFRRSDTISFSEISPATPEPRFPFPFLSSRIHPNDLRRACARGDDFAGGIERGYENDRKFYLPWWRERMLLSRGSPTATALPLRAQQLCVRSRATCCRLCGYTTLPFVDCVPLYGDSYERSE